MPLVPVQPGHDASVRPDSAFAAELRDLIHMDRPRHVLETGTLHALGTTLIVGEALKANGIEADFRTVECNPHHAAQARHNIARLGLPVRLIEGLSVPRSRLPAADEVESRLHHLHARPEAITADHPHESRVAHYVSETNHPTVTDNLIGKILDEWSGCCDLAVLDSAGHLGLIELLTLCEHLRSRCYIALDDCSHVKHWDTMEYARQRPEHLRVVSEGSERFGYAILHYTP